MKQNTYIAGWLAIEILLLSLGTAGLSSQVSSFIAIGYIAIACLIAAPFYAVNRLLSI